MKTYIDEIWYTKLLDIHIPSYIKLLEQDPQNREHQKNLFLSNKEALPHFQYPKIEELDLATYTQKYYALLKEIEENEKNIYIKEAYTRVIEEKLQHLEMLTAVANQDDDTFCTISLQEFGEVKKAHLALLLPYMHGVIKKAEQSKNTQVTESAVYLKNIIKHLGETTTAVSLEEDTTSMMDANDIQKRFLLSLSEYDIQDWSVVIDSESHNRFIHIDHKSKSIIIPQEREVTELHLEALVRHEVGVHIRRREYANTTNFRLLSLGLDRYINGEEGLSKYEEAKVYPQTFMSTVEIYVGIALIRGLDGVKRNFRDIYDFFIHYYRVRTYTTGHISEKDIVNLAWKRSEKLFRGTTGRSMGLCFTKDLIYWDGYLQVTNALEEFPKEVERVFIGKYDPSNQRHREILDGLNIH